jgi:DNA-binding LacI/PurR family transcriptional regulator
MPTASTSKRQLILDDIRRQIASGELRAGDPLPTQNELIDRYGVALGTLQVAMMQLQNEGLIWSRRGKGTFVAQARANHLAKATRKGTIGLLTSMDSDTPGLLEDISQLQSACEESGYHFVFRAVRNGQEDEAFERMGPLDGLIVWAAPTGAQLQQWADTGVPIVLIGLPWDGRVPDNVSVVEIDIQGLLQPLVDLVCSLGHRRVSLLSLGGSAYFDKLADLFRQATRSHGIQAGCEVVQVQTKEEQLQFARRIVAGAAKPSAVIVEHDSMACRFIHYVQNLGWQVPQKLSVACIGNVKIELLPVPGLSRTFVPTEDLFHKALQALTAMIASGRVMHMQAVIRLQVGQTCQALGRQASSAS